MTPASGSTFPTTPIPDATTEPVAVPPPLDEDTEGSTAPHAGMASLTIGAVGVVFGDIGTSPLYALKESFVGHHRLPVDPFHLFGVISLITWTMITVVLVKYVLVILRADNKGEGGSLALLALINRNLGFKRWGAGIVMLGVFATALFYGDSIITPAISVLSAVEGLEVVSPGFAPLVQPAAVAILIGLFVIQARGTAAVGKLFGPVMIVYFLVLAGLGIAQIAHRPEVLAALSPAPAFAFWAREPLTAFLALGSVVLAVTGAEALYADMGHFGRRPIAHAFYGVVVALILNYLGQAALMIGDPSAVENPFFRMAPDAWRLPLVILATAATVIASQAVISGAFSVTQQAIQLGFVPRMRIEHTSASAAGQIYLPVINWALLAMVILLVVGFRNSSALASAYGIAVTGTMFITSCMMAVLMLRVWKINRLFAGAVVALFLVVDGTYLASNLTKIPSGGWFPLAIGVLVFTLLTTWSKGRHLMIGRLHESAMPMRVFINSAASSASRVPGTAVFMTSAADGVPQALLHNLKHNKVLHERVILLTVKIVDMPYWTEERARHEALGEGFHRLVLRYGFMDDIDVPAALHGVTGCGAQFRMMDTSFFLSRQTLLPAERPGMMPWRERLFAWMLRNAESAMEYFRLPTNRVVELGSQVEI